MLPLSVSPFRHFRRRRPTPSPINMKTSAISHRRAARKYRKPSVRLRRSKFACVAVIGSNIGETLVGNEISSGNDRGPRRLPRHGPRARRLRRPLRTQPARERSRRRDRGQYADKHPGTVGRIIHYVFGTGFAYAYAAARTRVPQIAVGRGLAFGGALWLLSDAILIPAAHLGRPLWRYSFAERLNAVLSHLAYAATLEAFLHDATP